MNRKSLLQAVEFCSRVIRPTPLPVLECLHLKGDGQHITVTGYNLDLYARMKVEGAEVIDCCIAAKKLRMHLSAIPDEEISVASTPLECHMQGRNAHAILKVIDAGEFPEIPEVNGDAFPLPGEAIAKVLPAASTDETRYVINGVFLDESGHAVATDGRRMHSVAGEPHAGSAIIPTAAAVLLSGQSGSLRLDLNGNTFAASGDGWEIGGKLIDGRFPQWRQVTPGEFTKVKLNQETLDAIARAHSCRTKEQEKIEIGTGFVRLGDYHEAVNTGVLYVFTVNTHFLAGMLRSAGNGVEISQKQEHSAILFRNGDFTGVIMPIRPD